MIVCKVKKSKKVPAIPLNIIRSTIAASPAFSEQEKAEWVALLPQMNDRQLHELYDLLRQFGTPPELPGRPLEPELPPHLSPVHKAPSPHELEARLKSKMSHTELSPRPPIPKSQPVVPVVQGPTPRPVVPPPLKRNMAGLDVPKVLPPKPPISPFDSLYAEFPEHGGAGVRLQELTLENLNQISWADIRAEGRLESLPEEVLSFARKEGYGKVEYALGQSQLYALYLKTGQTLLHTGKRFADLSQDLKVRNKECLSEPEFNMVADLMRELRIGAQ